MAKRWSAGDKVLAVDLNNSVVPTGAILPFSGLTAPTDWLLCDGAAVSRTTYATLFALIGALYGEGDGSTTFNLPNLKNRIPIGVDAAAKDVIDNCDGAWTAGSNVVATNDTSDKKEGTGSVKLAVAAGATTNQILGYKAITSKSFAGRTTIGLWLKSSVALSSGDMRFQMDDTAALASPIESINIPALLANTWTKVYLTLATPDLDTAIISIGIYQVVDKGAFDLRIDDINAGENYEVGAGGGAKTHTLKTAELAAHSHSAQTKSGSTEGPGYTNFGTCDTNNRNVLSVSSVGGDLAHNNLQPYITLLYIIKT